MQIREIFKSLYTTEEVISLASAVHKEVTNHNPEHPAVKIMNAELAHSLEELKKSVHSMTTSKNSKINEPMDKG